MRQLCVTDLFSNKRVESFRSVRAEEVGALMRSVLAEGVEAPFAVRPKLLTATNHIISRMVLGKRLSDLAPRCSSQSIVALLNEASEVLGVFNLGDYLPFLAWMDLQGCERRIKVVAEQLKTVLQEVIDRRRRDKRTDGSPTDLLDVLLASSQTVETRDDNISAVLLDMIAAGTDTSAITIEWALVELLLNPEKLKIVQGEIDSVIGRSRIIQELDIPHLPYLQAVVKETMRLHPVAPLLIPHMSNKPCKILDFEIPPNTQAYVNVWAIGRDPNAWEKPEEFWPERFLDNIIDMQGQHFQLLPFGSGRRGCPGWLLGRLNVQIMLASLLQGFEWHISGELDLSETFRLTVMTAKPLLTSIIPRLAINLYSKWP